MNQKILKDILEYIRKAYENLSKSSSTIINGLIDMAVSFDGLWLTKGFRSRLGLACVIDIITSYVIDYVVMSKTCRLCN